MATNRNAVAWTRLESGDEERWSDPGNILKVVLIEFYPGIRWALSERKESRVMKGLGSEQWEEWIFLSLSQGRLQGEQV